MLVQKQPALRVKLVHLESKMQQVFVILLAFVCLFLSKSSFGQNCDIVISEFNSDDIGKGEFFEYIELMNVGSCNPAPVLRNYLLIIVKEYDHRLQAPSVVFSADFYRQAFKSKKKFFVIGSPNEAMKEKIDMPFSHPAVMFYRKHQSRSTPSITTFFTKTTAPSNLEDVIPNGNTSPFAAILLKDTNQDREENTGINKLRLTTRDERSHRVKTVPHLKIDDTLERLIKDHLHDIVVYARQSAYNDCGFFKKLLSPDEKLSLSLPAREWDRVGHEDLSLNRCPESAADLRKKFILTQWKLGKRTPGEANDCNGPQWILERGLPTILNEQGIDPNSLKPDSDPGITVPPTCSASTSIAGVVAAKSAEIVKSRDKAVEQSRVESNVVQDLTDTEIRYKLMLDEAVDRITDAFKGKKDEIREAEEPQVKARCVDAATGDPTSRPWLDHSHFTTAMTRQIERYQKDYVKPQWLTPARKSWLKYFFDSENPEDSKFQCRFCAAYVKKHNVQPVPDMAKPEGFFEKNFEKMKQKILAHTSRKIHFLALNEIQAAYNGQMETCLRDWEQKVVQEASAKDTVTSRMIRTVYSETKNNIPLDTHSEMVLLQSMNGLHMGKHHYERTSATRMLECISSTFFLFLFFV